MLNKVPEVTLYFWVIKILCTTVGETSADNLNEKVGLGLTNTTYIMGALLIATLVAQFRSQQVRPGHLLARGRAAQRRRHPDHRQHGRTRRRPDDDQHRLRRRVLVVTFALWYAVERTLSVHTINTTRREAFYWLVILFTFALGTSTGDYLSEKLELGYVAALAIFAGAIAVDRLPPLRPADERDPFLLARLHPHPSARRLDRRPTSPQPTEEGGLGLGTYITSAIFLVAILALVVYLAISKRDVIRSGPGRAAAIADGAPGGAGRPQQGRGQRRAARRRRRAGGRRAARFFVLVPNPHDLAFDRISPDHGEGDALLARALPQLRAASRRGGRRPGRRQPQRLRRRDRRARVGRLLGGDHRDAAEPSTSQWLHVDLPQRVRELGYPLTTVPRRQPPSRLPHP